MLGLRDATSYWTHVVWAICIAIFVLLVSHTYDWVYLNGFSLTGNITTSFGQTLEITFLDWLLDLFQPEEFYTLIFCTWVSEFGVELFCKYYLKQNISTALLLRRILFQNILLGIIASFAFFFVLYAIETGF